MTQSNRQARRAWAAVWRKHLKRGTLYHVEVHHDPECAIYMLNGCCNCDPYRILKDDKGFVLCSVEGLGAWDPLEMAEDLL